MNIESATCTAIIHKILLLISKSVRPLFDTIMECY